MCDLSSLVSGIINIVDVFGLIQFSLPNPYSFYEVGVYEVVGGSTVHQSFMSAML